MFGSARRMVALLAIVFTCAHLIYAMDVPTGVVSSPRLFQAEDCGCAECVQPPLQCAFCQQPNCLRSCVLCHKRLCSQCMDWYPIDSDDPLCSVCCARLGASSATSSSGDGQFVQMGAGVVNVGGAADMTDLVEPAILTPQCDECDPALFAIEEQIMAEEAQLSEDEKATSWVHDTWMAGP